MKYPRTLVVSNNSFSKTGSNGRTLASFFIDWPKDCVAQFCIGTDEPDYDVCSNYYLVTDKSAFDGFIHFRKAKRCVIENNINSKGNSRALTRKTIGKSPITMILRNVIWQPKRWKSKDFIKWVDSYNPEIVLLMNSDAAFILDIALQISKYKNIPLVMFNTEGYYFLKYNRFKSSDWLSNHLFSLYQHIYRRHFRELMKNVPLSIHLNSMLSDDYKSEFGGRHIVLYTGSTVVFDTTNLNLEKPIFSYLGNFGFDRPKALVELAEVLQSINSNYYLDVYGKVSSCETEALFEKCPCIHFHGMIPYEEVVRVMHCSTILFHAESQSEYFKESLRYGFSTKIADSVASGHPFLIYSSADIAGAKYIIETKSGWFAKNKHELKNNIISILSDDLQRNQVLSIAKHTAEQNHNAKKNSTVFRDELVKVVNDSYSKNEVKNQ